MSHPVWVRGLKPYLLVAVIVYVWSHPVWVRGLKLGNWRKRIFQGRVAPRVGAWIETLVVGVVYLTRTSRTPCGCVD